MKNRLLVAGVIVAITAMEAGPVFARGGGRGGGGGAGGGGARLGGTPSFNRNMGGGGHVPSMSRPTGMPVTTRPSPQPMPNRPEGIQRPGGANQLPNLGGGRPGTKPNPGNQLPNLPGLGNRPPAVGEGNRRPDGSRLPNQGNQASRLPNRPGIDNGFNRPSANDLSDFLDMPREPRLPDRTAIGNGNIRIGNVNTFDRPTTINGIRNKYAHIDQRPFQPNWWHQHHDDVHWHWHAGWVNYPAYWCYRPCTWNAFGTWFAWSWPQPYVYDYGNTVVYRENTVYMDNKPVASAEQYYQQAEAIAASVPADVAEDRVEWMPLGVFAIAKEGGADTGMLLQLAVSKQGILAGTFYNEKTNTSRPLEGMVDQKTQRAVWRFADGKQQEMVMETGIINLTKDESTALLHFDNDETETLTLVRLAEPSAESK